MEIELKKLTLNIKVHAKFYLKSKLLAHSKNQLIHWIEKIHTTCFCNIIHKKAI